MKCQPVFKEKVWGGHALADVLGKQLPDKKNYGESWEISAHPNGPGLILNGKFQGQTFDSVIQKHGKELLGASIWEKYQGKFPLLLKFLDINDKLSIQVHPDDSYAEEQENSFGKAECWYVISASEDAELVMGMKDDITREQYLSNAEQNKFDNMFKTVNVSKDDLVVIKPGMVHASLKGSILICELQQNSDITYRIYDFDREECGKKRDLHIEQSADVIDFKAQPDVRHFQDIDQQEIELLDWEYFVLKKLNIKGIVNRPVLDTMRLYSVLNGCIVMESGNTKLELVQGESVFVPAGLTVLFEGKAELLEAYPK
ncbi:MAG: type I phosphomannose isomerase catalytic subunit [Brevinemataceae bacterium]